jgi:hypothetical protein
MPYEDSKERQAVQDRATLSANRVQANLPESVRDRRNRQNLKIVDQTGESIMGLAIIETMTT